MKKILYRIFLVIAVLMFLGSIAFVALGGKSEDFYVFGYKPFIVATGSMETQYMTHSFVVIQQGGYDDVQVGDAIAFQSDALNNRLAFHRVVSITSGGFITRGDTNPGNDGLLVTRDNFIGRELFHNNLTAYYMQALARPFGWVRMIVLPVLAIILFCIGMVFLRRWKTDVWLKRLVLSSVLLLMSITALISYIIWDNQRIAFTNDKLREVSAVFLAQSSDTDTTTVNNRPVLGVIKIPSIDIEYPIIKFENNSSLDIAITKYAGPSLNEVGNVVLAGHRAAGNGNLFFTNINQLRTGDIATVIDRTGRSIDYRVTSLNVHSPDDLSVLKADKDNERELTLISCTANLRNRYVVKLVAVE